MWIDYTQISKTISSLFGSTTHLSLDNVTDVNQRIS